MKAMATIGAIAVALVLALPAGATGGSQSFRILVQGDLGAAAISSFCPNTYPEPAGIGANGLPFVSTCWAIKTQLGYDGTTGAGWDTSLHVNHSFLCSVTAAATPLNNIRVGFDLDSDTIIDVSYPNSAYRPLDETGILPGGVDVEDNPTGSPDVDNRVPNSVNPGAADGTLLGTVVRLGQTWPTVAGNIDGSQAVIFSRTGADQTVDCTF